MIPIPLIRDYHEVNGDLGQLLDLGHTHVTLSGADGQRLLLSGLTGAWNARIEVLGNVGPEFCAGMDADGLDVVCRGDAADGVGSRLSAGCVVVLGTAGSVSGYGQRGGMIVVRGDVGPRPGLRQRGGWLVTIVPDAQAPTDSKPRPPFLNDDLGTRPLIRVFTPGLGDRGSPNPGPVRDPIDIMSVVPTPWMDRIREFLP